MTTAPPTVACPRCGGSAPRGFLFCLDCAIGLTEQDENGTVLYDALVTEYEQLGQRIYDGTALLAEMGYGPRRDRGLVKLTLWRRQRDSLAYVLNIWRTA